MPSLAGKKLAAADCNMAAFATEISRQNKQYFMDLLNLKSKGQ